MKIYTRTGDAGETGLFGGARLPKDAARIEAYGTVDELNAVVGSARVALHDADLDLTLARVQAELFALGADLACTPGSAGSGAAPLGAAEITVLEHEIDRWEEELTALRNFILPGGSAGAAALHVARTICRRAERRLVALARLEAVGADALVYLNRLSDHLFVAARLANRRAGCEDVPWRPR